MIASWILEISLASRDYSLLIKRFSVPRTPSIKVQYLIYPNYLHMLADPIWWKIYPATVTAQLHLFFEHLFTKDLELHLFQAPISRRGVFSSVIHLSLKLRLIIDKCA